MSLDKFSPDFEIQTDHQISARKRDLILIKNKKVNCHSAEIALPVVNDPQRETVGQKQN